jgi:translation initiation factor 5B
MAKKDKKKAKQQDDYWDTEFQADAAAVAPVVVESHDPVEDTAVDDLVDDFGGLMSAIKQTKGKKGKKKQVEMVDANEELAALDGGAPAAAVGSASGNAKDVENDDAEDGEFRVKTKKEKEKEKKEREKAKKKAQVCICIIY